MTWTLEDAEKFIQTRIDMKGPAGEPVYPFAVNLDPEKIRVLMQGKSDFADANGGAFALYPEELEAAVV